MTGLLFIIPALVVAYWVLCRFTSLRALQRGVALGALVVFTELVAAAFWWPGAEILIRELVWGLLLAYLVGMLGLVRETRKAGHSGTGLHGWGVAFVTLLFALILLLNLGLVYISEQGIPGSWGERLRPEQGSKLFFPGLVREEARPHEDVLRVYLRGLRRLGERGWSLSEQWQALPLDRMPTALDVTIARSDQAPLSGARVQVALLSSKRPDHDRFHDFEEQQAGVYRAKVEFPDAGVWGLALRIDYDGETIHLLSTVTVQKRSDR